MVTLVSSAALEAETYLPARNGFITHVLVLGPIDAPDASRSGWETSMGRAHLDTLGRVPAPDSGSPGDTHMSPAFGLVAEIPRHLINPRRRRREGDVTSFTWALLSSPGPDLEIDLSRERHQMAFLYFELNVDTPFEGWLTLGGDDQIQAWIDGDSIALSDAGGALARDQHWIPLSLEPGRHTVLLKSYNRRGRWAAALRLLDTSGERPEGIRVSLPGVTFEPETILENVRTRLTRRVEDDGGVTLDYSVELASALPDYPAVLCVDPIGTDTGLCLPLSAFAIAPRHVVVRAVSLERGSNEVEVLLTLHGRREERVAPPPSVLAPAGLGSGLGIADSTGLEVAVADGSGAVLAVPPSLDTAAPPQIDEVVVIPLVAERVASFGVPYRRSIVDAIAGGQRQLAALEAAPDITLSPGSLDSYHYEVERIAALFARGDNDRHWVRSQADTLRELTEDFAAGRDPYQGRTGFYYRAYRGEIDGRLQQYAIFVPERYDAGEPIPLVLSMHGLGGPTMLNLRRVLGFDRSEGETANEAVRTFPDVETIGDPRAIFVVPYGYGDVVFRFMGEHDVLRVLEEVRAAFNVSARRTYLTGLSMGGISSFEFGLHFPDRFAAMLSLCGMADMRRYNEIRDHPVFAWEWDLVDEYSALPFAANAANLPVHSVHGTEDRTTPIHSRVLMNRLRELDYTTRFRTPELGHNVWAETYADFGAFTEVAEHRRTRFPERVVLTTPLYRYSEQYWVRLDALSQQHDFAEFSAEFGGRRSRRRIEASSMGVDAVTLSLADAPERWREGSLRIEIDGDEVCTESCWRVLHFERAESGWREIERVADRSGLKRAGMEGPAQDIWYGQPVALVYGTQDPQMTTPLRRLALAESTVRSRVDLELPVVADVDVTDELRQTHHLVLYGDRQNNLLVAEIDADLPIRVIDGGLEFGTGESIGDTARIDGADLSAVFIYPNPQNPTRYVLVKTATSIPAYDAIRFAPRYLPDFAAFDETIRTGLFQRTFRNRPVRAGGFFTQDWGFGPVAEWLDPQPDESGR